MWATLAAASYQPSSLQGLLHPCVAEFYRVLLLQLLVKMLHVQVKISISIQPQNLLHLSQRDSLGRRLTPPPVEQSVIAELFVALMPAPHLPVADANDLRRLPPRNLLCHRP